MAIRSLLLLLSTFLIYKSGIAQNRNYAQQIIDTLCSEAFDGRGYVNSGDQKAAAFIKDKFISAGLRPLANDYYHQFRFNVNTFPTDLILKADGKTLTPGRDFIVFPSSGSISETYTGILWVDKKYLSKKRNYKKLLRNKFRGTLLILDTMSGNETLMSRRIDILEKFKGETLLEIVPKLTWSVAQNIGVTKGFEVKAGVISKDVKQIEISINNVFKEKHQANNVAGYIKGTEYQDSFIVICGHYDHLGRMGSNVYFPGANDNASGIAMIFDMIDFFAKNPQPYSIAFICFAAEEAGLVGSYHWVKHSEELLPLRKIKFLINLDLMGSGDEGVMAVNGAVFKEEYAVLDAINKREALLPEVKARGKAANSDHYFFTEAGVHAFFFYLMGKYSHYHDIDDNALNLRLSPFYDKAFKLITGFVIALQKPQTK
jgi:hypothetical protein